MISAVRRVAREVPGAAAQIARVCSGHDYRQPGKPQIDWDDPAAKDGLVSGLVNDANALVAALQDVELDERARPRWRWWLARTWSLPRFGWDRWALADRLQGGRGPGDLHRRPDAWHTRKSPEQRRDGYRAHVAAEPETGIITDEALTRAAGADNAEVACRAVPGRRTTQATPIPARRQRCQGLEWYGDSAYGTGTYARRSPAPGTWR